MAVAHGQIRDYHQLPPERQSQTDLGAFLSQSNPDFAALLTHPSTSATDVLAQLQIDHPHAFETRSNSATAAARPVDPYRPGSAHSAHSYTHSHRGSMSGSEYSYATTEMDTDEADGLELDVPNGPPPAAVDTAVLRDTGLSWGIGEMEVDGPGARGVPRQNGTDLRGIDNSGSGKVRYPTPGTSVGDPSPPVVLTGTIRGPSHDGEDARQRRLERESQVCNRLVPLKASKVVRSPALTNTRPEADQPQVGAETPPKEERRARDAYPRNG